MSVLGQGSYGCVYKVPGLTCETNKSVNKKHEGKTLVTKMLLREHITPEVDAAEILELADPYQQYTIYALLDTLCIPTVSQAETCKATKNVPEDAIMFKMHAGDLNYNYLLTNLDFKTYPQAEIIILWHAIHLFEALQKIHTEGLYHLDIKPENVILTTFSNNVVLPRLIDFGLCFASDKYPSWDEGYNRLIKFWSTPYVFAPPENQILMSYGGDPDLKEYKAWVNSQITSDIHWFPWLLYYDIEQSYKTLTEIIHKDIPNIFKNHDRQFVYYFFQSMDVYMLSSMFLRALSNSVSEIWNVLKEGVNPDYRQRPTARQMLQRLEAIQLSSAQLLSLRNIPAVPKLPYLTKTSI